MPQNRADEARQAGGEDQPEDEEKLLADGWIPARGKRKGWFKIMDVLPNYRRVDLNNCMGGCPESAAAID